MRRLGVAFRLALPNSNLSFWEKFKIRARKRWYIMVGYISVMSDSLGIGLYFGLWTAHPSLLTHAGINLEILGDLSLVFLGFLTLALGDPVKKG
jgi:hypothetical protein